LKSLKLALIQSDILLEVLRRQQSAIADEINIDRNASSGDRIGKQ